MDNPSSSSSSSFLPRPIDVFLSFRGDDTRNNFVSHLHGDLNRKAVVTYLDNADLKKGDDLSDILKAISESKISIVVFSKNYATSKWCLNELLEIMKCRADPKHKQEVVPIFYKVDPSEIRKQTGRFGEAFVEHEKLLSCSSTQVQSWKCALTEASNIAGWSYTKTM